jgi:preprotein translocase subunit SecE
MVPLGHFKILKFMEKFISFLKDVKIELSKVSWPTKDQTIKYTIIVIALSLGIAIFLGGVDFGLQMGLSRFIIK